MRKMELSDITKKHPFVYEVDGNLVVMGSDILYQYAMEDPFVRAHWKHYRDTIERIGRNRLDTCEITAAEEKDIFLAMRKLIAIGEFIQANVRGLGQQKTSSEEICEYLASLDTEEQKNVQGQLEDYVRCSRYYSE